MSRRRSLPDGFTLVELLIVVAVIAIIAAIAIPALLRARIAANESAAIGDMRTVVSAEAAYNVANGGFYDGNIRCLNAPVDCIPAYPSNGPNFLDSQLTSLLSKGGYSRSYAGGETPGTLNTVISSLSSATSYVYWATPTIGGQTGLRGFAADSSGLICFSPQGDPAETTGNIALLSPGVACNILQD
jgi:type IV pilus assembly protein PilA